MKPLMNVTVILVLLYTVFCAVMNIYVAYMIPVSFFDLENSSWLFSYSMVTRFTSGSLGVALASLLIIIGFSLCLLVRDIRSFIIGLCICLMAYFATSELHAARLGYINNMVKIGCYVEDTVECNRMLGVPFKGKMSMYTDTGEKSTWYVGVAPKLTTIETLYSLPLVMCALLPFKVLELDIESVLSKMKRQGFKVKVVKKRNTF